MEIAQDEIRPLIFNYIFHFFLCIIIFVIHLVIYNKIYWVYKAFSIIFIICSYFGIINVIYPIFPSFFIFKKNFNLKIIKIIGKTTIILLIISSIFGLFISIILIINAINSKLFCKECPFNISLSHLNYIFSSYYGKITNEKNLKESCNSRRCILDTIYLNDEYPYKYLCNYDASDDFKNDKGIYKRKFQNGSEIETKNQVICSRIYNSNDILFNNNELYNYFDLCYILTEFYICKRFNMPKKSYKLSLDIACPETNYLFLLYVLTVLIIIIDIVIVNILFGSEVNSLFNIVQIFNIGVIKPNSNHSTAKSSIESNKENTFKKEKTEVIVSPSSDEENIISINNVINNKKKLYIKNSTDDFLNNDEEDKKTDPVFKGIKIIQNNGKKGEEKSIIIENLVSENNNLVNIFKASKNQNDVNVTTNFENNTNNLNVRDRIEKNNK